MLLAASSEETYCLKTQNHIPVKQGAYYVCYRCSMLLGPAIDDGLGTLLDY